jgi:hypothetical protein
MTNADPEATHHREIERYVTKDHPEDESYLILECQACGARAQNLWSYEDDPEAAVAGRLTMEQLNQFPCVPDPAG